MSVLPMKRVLIVGLRKNRKQILELLQRKGVMEITLEPSVQSGQQSDPVFHQIDMSGARATFDKNCTLAVQALAVLDHIVPDTNPVTMFSGRQKMSLTDYETNVARRDNIMEMVYRLGSLSKQLTEIQAEIPRLETQLEALQPWLSFEYPMDFEGTRCTKAFIGTLPNEVTELQILTQLGQYAPDVSGTDISIISASSEQTCIMIICLKKDAQKVEEALRHMNFARPSLSGDAPSQQANDIRKRLVQLHADETEIQNEIASFADRRNELKFIIDYFSMRSDKYAIINGLQQSNCTFLLSGYVRERDSTALETLLTARFNCVVDFYEPDDTDDVPVALRNNAFASPLESVIESYSLPGKGEADPTFPVSCFYYILFGLMLSDAAYGLILVIACAVLLKKFQNMEAGMKKTLHMFLLCGVGTVFWGFMFGSFFGDATNVIATTFFGRPDIKLPPIWFEPIALPIKMMAFSFLLGLIHLFTGLTLKLKACIKSHHYLDAVYDVIFWYMLVGGSVIYLLTVPMMTAMLGLTFVLPSVCGQIAAVCMIISAVGIILTGGRESRNWFKRILKGLYSLYGITGYLSDVLSYSRLLALGLATSVIATVFNKMGSMVASGLGGGIVGFIIFMVIFIIGHLLNLAINALGAYVHTNRLQYVEFFGKFYEGGGRPFEPFKEQTKYYKVQE